MIEVYLSGTQILPTDPLCLADVPIVVDATVRSRKTATLTLRSRNNATSPQAGQEVTMFAHGGAQKFGGYIDSAPRTLDHIGQRDHALTCRDYSSLCDLRSAGERVYLNTRLNDIIRDIVTDSLATDGVGLTNVPAGGGPTIERLEIDYSTVAEAINAACKQAGREWEIDNDKEFRIFQPSAGSSLGTLNDTTAGIIDGTVKGKESLSGYANKVVVILSRVLIDAPPETFNGSHPDQPTDGSRKDWTVAYPVNSVPTITVNGAAKTVGLADVDTGKDWYWQASSAIIRQDNAAAALTSGDTLEIVYVGEQSQQVFAQDAAEIAVRAALETRSGVYEKIIRSSAPVAATDAQGFANAVLAELKQVPYEIEFETQGLDFNPGEKWTLGFSGHPTGDYLVTRVQWFTVGGSWDSAASSPQARQRVYMSRGVLTRDIYESWKEAFSGGGGSVTVTGGSASGGGSGSTSAPWHTITYASAITPNLANGKNQRCTLTGDVTVNFPTGATDGAELRLVLIQDSTGGRTVTLATGWKLDGGEVVALPSTKSTIEVCFKSSTEVESLHFTNGVPA
jgi:hypothetical protein